MTPDEVRLLPKDKAIVLIGGKRPVIDDKFPLESHRNYGAVKDRPYERRFKHYEQKDLSFEVEDLAEIEFVEE